VSLLLGCIADDFTGATDLANTLVKAGMRTIQLLGVPKPSLEVPPADCIIVALKSRSNPPAEAVQMSLAALDWLRNRGAQQYYFKYCSTFDSTDRGNIGPVADALLDVLGVHLTVFNPAFPTNKRTVYKGYLFVVDRIKDLIIRGGINVYPRDVEDALLEHPDIVGAGVVGRNDDRMGEEVVAFVALRPGAALTADDVIAYAKGRLSAAKYPRDVRIVDALPLTSVFKLDRKALRTML